MRPIILKLALAVAGLLAAFPAPARAQPRQFFVTGGRFGPWSNVNIFAMPLFRMTTDPRGANFGFNQQLLFAPSYRGWFSPFNQVAVFRSDSSASLVFNPLRGPVATVNTPAVAAFTFSPVNGLRQFMIPSQTILADTTGAVVTFNPVTPTFLAGTFNFAVPVSSRFAFPLNADGSLGAAIPLGSMRPALSGAFSPAIDVNGGLNADAFLTLGMGMPGLAADINPSAATLAVLLTLTQEESAAARIRDVQKKADNYKGYVPASHVKW